MRWKGHVKRMGDKRGAYRVLVGTDHLEDIGERWEDNTKMNLQGMGWEHGLD